MKPIVKKIYPKATILVNNLVSHKLWCYIDGELWIRVDDKVFGIGSRVKNKLKED